MRRYKIGKHNKIINFVSPITLEKTIKKNRNEYKNRAMSVWCIII